MRGKVTVRASLFAHRRITPAHAGKSLHNANTPPRDRDHPRPCGEKVQPGCGQRVQQGSPPPMRGKAASSSLVSFIARITPAHAGKSTPPRRTLIPPEDHPRPCGEKYDAVNAVPSDIGSPPPMRGKALIPIEEPLAQRITPAHAGKSLYIAWGTRQITDHPRPCGEKLRVPHAMKNSNGSPPPMRGKVENITFAMTDARITPAHAGKSPHLPGIPSPPQDHPRPCGEKLYHIRIMLYSAGSPPPMRGKELEGGASRPCIRITPAHAGKRCKILRCTSVARDHPRPCGEKRIARTTMLVHIGSPPPMRGKAADEPYVDRRVRITPAHAGKSMPVSLDTFDGMDHPRPCGEKYHQRIWRATFLGSPPPMRGKAKRSFNVPFHIGITPAHAGKSARLVARHALG